MSRGKLVTLAFVALLPVSAQAQHRLTEDRELTELDLKAWDCLNQPTGTAKSPDGAERNRGKNRAVVPLAGLALPNLETAGFLRLVSAFDAQTRGKRRADLNSAQLTQLAAMEKQLVSFTAYLVIAYAGPPESTNCGSVEFHDWHLELFEKPADHAPRIGDPTPIICEITPRTQSAIFRDGIRMQNLAAFIRAPDTTAEPTGKKAQRIRLTGYLLWDDEHNGSADVGTTIHDVGKNKYHHPWRATAWEMHPVLKIEPLEGAAAAPISAATPVAVTPATPAAMPFASPQIAVNTAPAQPKSVTIVEPVKIRIQYGETVLPRGMRLEIIARDAQTVTVDYLGTSVKLPLQSTDLRDGAK